MSKSATILGLTALAAAGSVPAYGSSAPAYADPSSSYVYSAAPSSSYAYPASSAAPSYPASSDPAAYGSSWGVSSAPSSSYVYSAVPSSSSYYYSVSSAVPSSPVYPPCWSTCFEEAGITSEADLCGNVEVDKCIHDGCCQEESWAYWQWYDSYCGVASSSYYIPSSSVPVSPVSSSAVLSSPPVVECWGKCFAENGITSEDELCGNTAVDECISTTCDCEDDKAYWVWYESYCTAPAPSSSVVVPSVPTSTPEDCWGKCFEEAGIASEEELCGNTAVDSCIHDTCTPAEDKAYWAWYLSYCPAPSSPITTPCVTPTPVPSSPVANCWSDCFAEYDVTSEASLCGDDEVSKCIHDTCSADLDKAYWDWYNGFCAAETTSVITITTVYSATPTTYEITSQYGYTPVESSPVTGLPVPPVSPVAPYGGYSTPASGAAVPTGYPAPSASAWSPVPATGAGSVTKPGVIVAMGMALVALL